MNLEHTMLSERSQIQKITNYKNPHIKYWNRQILILKFQCFLYNIDPLSAMQFANNGSML